MVKSTFEIQYMHEQQAASSDKPTNNRAVQSVISECETNLYMIVLAIPVRALITLYLCKHITTSEPWGY